MRNSRRITDRAVDVYYQLTEGKDLYLAMPSAQQEKIKAILDALYRLTGSVSVKLFFTDNTVEEEKFDSTTMSEELLRFNRMILRSRVGRLNRTGGDMVITVMLPTGTSGYIMGLHTESGGWKILGEDKAKELIGEQANNLTYMKFSL